jgi:hypothetical protein
MVIIRRPEVFAERLRETFGSIADIAGFWAPDLHPLAGTSYRRALLSGIRQAIHDVEMEFPCHPIALVGHSQGSVLCAWFIRGRHWTEQDTEAVTDRRAVRDGLYGGKAQPSTRIALYTCGSPLVTLYRTFFPRYFDDEFFVRTRAMTYRGSSWHNYWRRTDPIASELPQAVDRDVTEKIDEPILGHGEYWKERQLRNDIGDFFDATEIPPQRPAPAAKRCAWCQL